MNEPRRLLETERGLGRALLDHGANERPSANAKRRIAGAVITATAGATTASVAGASAASAKVAWSGLLAWLGVGALSGVGLLATAHFLREPTNQPTNRAPAYVSPLNSAPAPIASAPGIESPSAQPPSTTPQLAQKPPPSFSAAVGSAVASTSPQLPPMSSAPAPVDTLPEEVARLDRARKSLAEGNPDDAIRQLDEKRPMTLAPEALVLRIEVLLAKGDRQGAAAAAQHFLATYPNSPLEGRVRALLNSAQRP